METKLSFSVSYVHRKLHSSDFNICKWIVDEASLAYGMRWIFGFLCIFYEFSAYNKHYDSTVIVRLPNDAIHLTISFRLGHCTDSFSRLNLVFVAFVSISAVQTFPSWVAWQNHRNHFLSVHLLSFMHDGSQFVRFHNRYPLEWSIFFMRNWNSLANSNGTMKIIFKLNFMVRQWVLYAYQPNSIRCKCFNFARFFRQSTSIESFHW